MPSVQTPIESAGTKQERWDWRYLDLARFISLWSKDKTKVGAIIVNSKLGRIIAVGFNGFPTNITDCVILLTDKDKTNKSKKREMIIYAEQNALLFAGRDARDCHLYVVGKPICNTCAILAIQSGIKRVIAASPVANSGNDWDKLGCVARGLLREAKVKFVPISRIDWQEPEINSFESNLMRPKPRNRVRLDPIPIDPLKLLSPPSQRSITVREMVDPVTPVARS
jgi:dCMP deaminase